MCIRDSSIAGARKGFDDIRGALFFKIARIAALKKPKYLFLDNVPGLLNHDEGRTFESILRTGSPKSYKPVSYTHLKNFEKSVDKRK